MTEETTEIKEEVIKIEKIKDENTASVDGDDEDDVEIININDTNYNVINGSITLKNETAKEMQELFKESNEIDGEALSIISDVIMVICQQRLSELKKLLIEKEGNPIEYFQVNPFIKEGFFLIYNFIFEKTHLSDQFSSFFAFKDILCYIKGTKIYKQVFELTDEILDEKINLLKKVLDDIIQKQMKNKKTIKNRKVNKKRKEKEFQKRVSAGLIPPDYDPNKDSYQTPPKNCKNSHIFQNNVNKPLSFENRTFNSESVKDKNEINSFGLLSHKRERIEEEKKTENSKDYWSKIEDEKEVI